VKSRYGAVILLRPTKSLALFLQQCGRGMRPAPGKSSLLILDHVGNCARFGPPDLERIWSLEGLEAPPMKRSKGEGEGVEVEKRSWTTADGRLVEIAADRLELIAGLSHRQVVEARLSRAELEFYAQHRGYRPGWVFYRLKDQEVAA
jgi:DNA repair protein RadD